MQGERDLEARALTALAEVTCSEKPMSAGR